MLNKVIYFLNLIIIMCIKAAIVIITFVYIIVALNKVQNGVNDNSGSLIALSNSPTESTMYHKMYGATNCKNVFVCIIFILFFISSH